MKFLQNFTILVISACLATSYDPLAEVEKCFDGIEKSPPLDDVIKQDRTEYNACKEIHPNNPVCITACQLEAIGMISPDGFIIKAGASFEHTLPNYIYVGYGYGDPPAPTWFLEKYTNGSDSTVRANSIIQVMYYDAGDRMTKCLTIDEIPFPHRADGSTVIFGDEDDHLRQANGCQMLTSDVMEAIEHYINCFKNTWEHC